MKTHRLIRRLLPLVLAVLLLCTSGARAEQTEESAPFTIRGTHALFLTLKGHEKSLEAAVGRPVDFSMAGGCDNGIEQAKRGGVGAICCPLHASELQGMGGGVVHQVAQEPLMVITHPRNPVTSITTQQARDLFAGRIDNWKMLGGPDLKVVVVMRPHCALRPGHWKTILPSLDQWQPDLFVHKFLKMITTVSKLPGAVGHLGTVLHDAKRMNRLTIDGIDPLDQRAIKRGYPFYRPISLLTLGPADADEKRLIDFLRSPRAHGILAESHLIPSQFLAP
ncbi:MAG: hypothetical protein HQL50_06615 [Magnetococcales bacterium]|nr:hypothetical protein [Magnetococcales bacterium]